MSKKISIITPSYNSGTYIEEAIRSVLIQEYENFEHIVVDGGSRDNTLEILRQYPHIKWVSEADKGQSHAMNKGFAMSSGEIIGYLNADDYYLPGAFKSVVSYFEDEARFVVGKVKVILEDGSSWINDPKVSHKEMLHHWQPDAFCVNSSGYFYLREVQEKVKGFNEDNTSTMDLEFLLAASRHFEFTKVSRLLGVFRLLRDSKTVLSQKDEEIWTTKNFFYIDQYLEGLSREEIDKFNRDREEGYKLRKKWQREESQQMKGGHRDSKEKDQQIAQKDVQLKQKDQLLQAKTEQLAWKEQQLARKEQQLDQKDQQIARKEQQLLQKDQQIERKDTQLRQKDEQMEQKEQQLKESDQQFEKRLKEKDRQLAQKDQQLLQKDQQIERRDTQLRQKDEQMEQKDRLLAENEKRLKEKDLQIIQKDQQLLQKDQQIVQKNEYLQQRDQELQTLVRQLAEKEQEIARKDQLLAQGDRQLKEKARQLTQKTELLEKKSQDLQHINQELVRKDARLRQVLNSKSFRVGKFMLSPFALIKRIIKSGKGK